MELANYFTRANYVRDYCGNKGAGVKIGMIESGVPDISDSYLTQATITKRSGSTNVLPHATRVARVLVGTNSSAADDGFAPNAHLYCCTATDPASFYDGIEWLVDSGVNVINCSFSFDMYILGGTYDIASKWVDHLAVMHDVHFVVSAGNNPPNISSPGMAYNAMTVGAFSPGTATSWSNISAFSVASYSAYDETGSNRAEKPNLIANGDSFWGAAYTGTSFSAPQVTGIIAQLCSYQPTLKYKQTAIGAILMAATAHKINANGTGNVGDIFDSLFQVGGEPQISDNEGSGILDALWARDIVSSGKYWSATVYDAGFPYNQTVSITANENTVIRVCIFWLRQNSVSKPHKENVATVATMSNLDLYVLTPNGSIADASTLTEGNFEIVQFVPHMSGTYTIQIRDIGNYHTGKDYIGIALWTGTSGQ